MNFGLWTRRFDVATVPLNSLLWAIWISVLVLQWLTELSAGIGITEFRSKQSAAEN